jgi:hypothetical protein
MHAVLPAAALSSRSVWEVACTCSACCAAPSCWLSALVTCCCERCIHIVKVTLCLQGAVAVLQLGGRAAAMYPYLDPTIVNKCCSLSALLFIWDRPAMGMAAMPAL